MELGHEKPQLLVGYVDSKMYSEIIYIHRFVNTFAKTAVMAKYRSKIFKNGSNI